MLSRVVRFFEAKGIAVRGAHEVAPGLLVLGGPAGALSLDRQGLADAELGFAVRAALGALDAGQAVVTEGGRVLAIEGAEGTDAMLRRVADLRGARAGAAPSGVLAKGPKPGQELRVDMPTIGPRTVEGAAAAGLAGVAVEAGAVLLLDRTEAVKAADTHGIAIEGLTAEMERGGRRTVPSPLVGEGQGGGNPRQRMSGLPPPLTPPHKGEGNPALPVGRDRFQPSASQATCSLTPAARRTSRRGSPPSSGWRRSGPARPWWCRAPTSWASPPRNRRFDLLERTRALRQWGVGAKRRVGVVACRADCGGMGCGRRRGAARQGRSGGPRRRCRHGDARRRSPISQRAGALADRHGLFLSTRGEQP